MSSITNLIKWVVFILLVIYVFIKINLIKLWKKISNSFMFKMNFFLLMIMLLMWFCNLEM